MKMIIFSVYDSKAQSFLPPFFMQNDGMAVRIFSECANDKEHQFGRFSSDFTLFAIGEFDDATGIISPAAQHRSLGLAASFVRSNFPVACEEVN